MTVMVDGGIRRGTDVHQGAGARRAFRLDRPAVPVSPPIAGGEAGVQRAITLLKAEIDRDLALLGIRTIGEITPDLVRKF